ncbi:haloacid dehalogenase-like hydrolase [Saccharothrix deserti]|uniref:haloacid dehalogenase-like hydrolase n=1 Tax=Saccharothrix deserti TaxID=2593674 RepID=UPI00131BCA88|nr:haloacid dehalogenase-like hydrolase [Saccharothrix deserti]
MNIAVLDVDGTLLPGALADPLPAMLLDAGLSPRDRGVRLRELLATGEPETPPRPGAFNELFAAMLTDVPRRPVSALMAELWLVQRERLFDFTRPLVAAVREAGFTPMLISGGPEEMVAHLAAELGVDRFRGTRFAVEDDLYTGEVESTVEGAKDKVALELAAGAVVAWSRSLAIGNSLGDVEVFKQVGHRIAFEPTPGLLAVARENRWHLADRTDLPDVLRDRVGITLVRRPSLPPPSGVPAPQRWDLRDAAERLTTRILAEVTPSGAVVGHNDSRVTESALMLTLLRRENLLPAAQRGLRAYLAGRAPTADAFDTAVINSALYGIPVPDRERLIDQTFEGAAQHSSARKRLALAAILAVVGSEPFHVDAPSDAFRHRGEATWTRLRMMAIHHLNSAEPVAPELTARLLRLTETGQRRGIGVIERQTFSHLFALLALNRVLPGHPVIREGVTALAAHLKPDGGLALNVSEEVFATATAGLALARAGVDRSTLIAMADYTAAQQAEDGGWPFAPDVVQTDLDTATHAMAFLHVVDPARYRTHVAGGLRYLRHMARSDGGFPTYLAGQPAEATMTANAVMALVPHAREHHQLMERAAGFIVRSQRSDGTFERSWSLSEANAIFRVLIALRAVYHRNPAVNQGRLAPAMLAAERRVLTTANPDGGWGQTPGEPSDPVSTAYSLMALAWNHRDSEVVRDGIRYLLSRQDPDGGYTSVSDQAAPRPLRYGVPILVNNYVLLAMTYLDPGFRYAGHGLGKHTP